jgi:hypothetical protein
MEQNSFKIQITGAFEDNEHVRLTDFIEQLNAIKETLNELDKKLSKTSTTTVDYKIVDLSHSSPSSVVLEAIPLDPNNNNTVQIIDRFFEGIEKINSGTAPEDFDSNMLERFGKIGKSYKRRINRVMFFRNSTSVQIGETFEAKIKQIVGEDKLYDGSVEGTLEMINLHRGVNKFNIYPIIGVQKITCHFPNKLLKDAISSVGRYINVTGKLIYKERDKFPYKIDVQSIEIYPEENELPNIFDLRGIAPDMIGNISSEEFVRRGRDGKQ